MRPVRLGFAPTEPRPAKAARNQVNFMVCVRDSRRTRSDDGNGEPQGVITKGSRLANVGERWLEVDEETLECRVRIEDRECWEDAEHGSDWRRKLLCLIPPGVSPDVSMTYDGRFVSVALKDW